MKKASIYSLIALLVGFISACSATVQTYDLNEEYATSLHYQPPAEGEESDEPEEGEELVGIPARNFYGGDLKRGAIWFGGKNVMFEKGDQFSVNVISVGNDTAVFGATFPPIDLIKEKVVLKITARADSSAGDPPLLYLQAEDANGYQANTQRPFLKIEKSSEFKEYYFDLSEIVYQQSLPKKHKVNGALINSLKFFIHTGQSGYNGKIFIKEIKIEQARTK